MKDYPQDVGSIYLRIGFTAIVHSNGVSDMNNFGVVSEKMAIKHIKFTGKFFSEIVIWFCFVIFANIRLLVIILV